MTLRELIAGAGLEVAPPAAGEDAEIAALAYSTAGVTPGALFFCVPGFRADGHDFAPEAVERGAVALVCERPLGLGVPEVLVDDVRAAMGPVAARFYGDPTAELDVVGITGTNGKTTTAFLVRHLLEGTDVRTGLLGTVKRVVGGGGGAGRWGRSKGWGEAWRRTWSAPRPRRWISRPRSGACSTPGTGPAPWRCRRTRWSWAGRPASGLPAGCSPTSPRTTSTSTRRWRTTSSPSGACSRGPVLLW